jgi:hypothetical protein
LTGTVLLNYGDPDNCKGNLAASNGTLYDASYFDFNPTTKYLEIYKRDLTTGKFITSETKSWSVLDYAQYKNYVKFAFDGNIAYWARMRLSDGQIEIWENDFSSELPSLVFADVVPNFSEITFFDASNGHLAIGDQMGYILLYDVNTQTSESGDIGIPYYGLQILYLSQ